MVVSYCFLVVKLYTGFSQLVLPFQIPFHLDLQSAIPGPMVTFIEFCSAFAFLCCGLYMKPTSVTSAIDYAFYVHIPLSLYLIWAWVWVGASFSVIQWIWFLGLSLGYTALCKHLQENMQDVESSVQNLYNYTYAYKKA
jgi:hypothetical protein